MEFKSKKELISFIIAEIHRDTSLISFEGVSTHIENITGIAVSGVTISAHVSDKEKHLLSSRPKTGFSETFDYTGEKGSYTKKADLIMKIKEFAYECTSTEEIKYELMCVYNLYAANDTIRSYLCDGERNRLRHNFLKKCEWLGIFNQTEKSGYEEKFEMCIGTRPIYYVGMNRAFISLRNRRSPDFIWLSSKGPLVIEVYSTYQKIDCNKRNTIMEYLEKRYNDFGYPVIGFDQFFFNLSDTIRCSFINFLLDIHINSEKHLKNTYFSKGNL